MSGISGLIWALDYLSAVVFAITGALVASRRQLDLTGFIFMAAMTFWTPSIFSVDLPYIHFSFVRAFYCLDARAAAMVPRLRELCTHTIY